MNFTQNPIIIGAVGGSGTRIFTKIIRYAGIYMGSDLNEAEENEDNKSFYRAWLPLYLMKTGQPGLEQFGYWNSFNWQQIEKAATSSRFERYLFQRIGMKNLPL